MESEDQTPPDAPLRHAKARGRNPLALVGLAIFVTIVTALVTLFT